MTRFFTIAGRVVTLLAFIAVLSFSSAPYLLNSLLLPRLLGSDAAGGITVHISRLSPWMLTGAVALDGKDSPAAAPIHFSVKYRPLELMGGRITAVTLDGGTIRLAYAEGKLRVQGFPVSDKEGAEESAPLNVTNLPVIAKALYIRNTQILYAQEDGPDLLIATQGEVYPECIKAPSGGYRLKTLRAIFLSQGQIPGSLEADVVLTDEHVNLTIKTHLPEVAGLGGLLSLPEQLRLSGAAQLAAEIVVPFDFKSISHINAELRLPGLQVVGDGYTLTGNNQEPLTITVDGTDTALHYAVQHLALSQPAELETSISGTVSPVTGELTGSGEVHTGILRQPALLELQGKIGQDNTTELTVKLRDNGRKLQLGQPTVTIGPYQLGLILKKDATGLLANGDIQIASVGIADELLMENISGQLPVVLQNGGQQNETAGRIVIDRIRYKKDDLAGLTASLRQTSNGFTFTGELKSHLAKPLRLQFAGESSLAQPLTLTFNLPQSTIDNRSLPSFTALPPGLEFSGKILAKGTFTYTANRAGGEMTVSINEGNIDLKDKKIHLGGIAADLTLPALPQLASRSHQQLRIGAMEIGNLKFSDGNIFFRIEDQQTLFIEKSRFTWCNGKVESGSLEISLVNPELSTTLYCDRLQFSELLSQLGISDTEGDGSLNGRLPLHFTGKQMIFDDGFLFSTPGNSGIVRFNNTAMLRQGLPETGRTAYLEYSMQAMENFSYNWTKLTFNSKGDDLLISMEIDGKPAAPLPFGYQSGQLVARTEGQGIQHPIRLDVNFHLPFTQMFKYGQNIQKIMEKKK